MNATLTLGFTLHATNHVNRLPTFCLVFSLGYVPHGKLLVPCHGWTWGYLVKKMSC